MNEKLRNCPDCGASLGTLHQGVTDVPDGFELTRVGHDKIAVSRADLGGYVAEKDDPNIASSVLFELADSILGSENCRG